MRKLYVIEGPDCSGKTTLAKYIADATNGFYMHMSGNKAFHPVMPEYHFAVFNSIEWTLRNVSSQVAVLDRSWPSELVYGREFRPELVHRFDWQALDSRIRDLDGAYVLCLDDDVEERHASQQSPDHPYDRAAFHGIVRGYEALQLQMSNRDDWFHYNMFDHGSKLREFVERIS